MGVGLYHLRCCKFDRWPPASPAQSQSDREAVGARRFLLWPPRGSFGTSWPRHHHLPLPSLGAGQLGPLRWLVSHLCLWRPVYCSGRGWMSFHPGLRWTFSCPDQRLVGLHPDAFQRPQWLGSQSGSASVGEIIRLVGPRVLWVPAALGGEGRHGAGLTVPLSSDSSLRAQSIL